MALVECAARGDVASIRQLLATPDINVNCTGRDGTTALCAAAMWGWADIVRILVKHDKIDLDAQNVNAGKSTALHLACLQESAAIADMLIDSGAGMVVLDAHGATAIDYASCSDVVWPLFEKRGATRTHKSILLKLGVIRKAEEEELAPISARGGRGVLRHISRPGSAYVMSLEHPPLTARAPPTQKPPSPRRQPLSARGFVGRHYSRKV